MKKLYKLILIILSLFTIHCFNEPPFIGKKKSKITIGEYVNFCMFTRRSEIWNEVEDNRDGTISLVTYSGIRNNPLCSFGEIPTRKVNYIVKKCIQGQVYRQTENDCKGAGSAANYYNAQKFQWCGNLNGCTDSELPALSECKRDTFKGLIWDSLSMYESKSSSRDSFYLIANFFIIRDDVPKGESEYYWLDGFAYNMVNDFRNFKKLKVENFFVICNQEAKI